MAFCKNCGQEIPEGIGICPNCGVGGMTSQNVAPVHTTKIKMASVICFIVAGLVLLLSLIAGFRMLGGAGELASIRSQAGNSIAEAYYNECGTVYGGLAWFVIAFGLFASGLLTYLGLKDRKK